MFSSMLELFIIGSLAGLFAGFLGVGGGVIIIPVMLIYLESIIPEKYLYLVVSTIALSVAFTSSIFGSVRHIKNKNLYNHTLLPIAIGSVLGAIPGSIVSELISTGKLKAILSIIIVFVSIKMLRPPKKCIENGKIVDYPPYLFLIGFLVGVFSSLTGLGGGVIFVPVLTTYFLFNPKKAAGTSGFIMMFNTLPAIIYRVVVPKGVDLPLYSVGYFIPEIILPTIGGTAIFAQVGAQINHKISPNKFRVVAALIFFILAVRTTYSAFF